MPTYSIDAPDGIRYTIEGPPGATREDIAQQVMLRNPKAAIPANPQSGLIPAIKGGAAKLASDAAGAAARFGWMDPTKAEEYQEDKARYIARTHKAPTKGWLEAPLDNMADTVGGSIPFMAGTMAAGATAAAAAPAAVPAAIAAGLGAGVASGGMQFLSNLSAQHDTGVPLTETNVFNAAAASIPQALLDTVSLGQMSGVGKILGKAAKSTAEETLARMAGQSVFQKAREYAAVTGKSMSMEGVTEALQQYFERLQAGLSTNSPAAWNEYAENFKGGAALASVIAPFGHHGDRSRSRVAATKEISARDDAAAAVAETAKAEQDAQAAQAEQARRKDPAYVQSVAKNYAEVLAKRQELAALAKTEKGADPAAVARAAVAKEQLASFDEEHMNPAVEEYNSVYPQIQAAEKAQAGAVSDTGSGEVQAPVASTPRPPMEVRADQERNNTLYEQHQQALSDANAAGDYDAAQKASDALTELSTQRSALTEELKTSIAESPSEKRAQAVTVLAKVEAALRKQTGPGVDPAKVRELLERRTALLEFLRVNGDPRVEGQEQYGQRGEDLSAAASQQGVPNQNAQEEMSPEELLAAQTTGAPVRDMSGYEDSSSDVEDAAGRFEESEALRRIGQRPVPMAPNVNAAFGTAQPNAAMRDTASPAIASTGQQLQLFKLAQDRNEAWTAREELRDMLKKADPNMRPAERASLKEQFASAHLRHKSLDKTFQVFLAQQKATESIPTAPLRRTSGPSGTAQRAPGANFALHPRPADAAGPTVADIQTRLTETLNREDLSPSARALLERLNNVVLPKSNAAGVLTAIDARLTAIERGQEGVVRPGENDRRVSARGVASGAASATQGYPAYKYQLDDPARRTASPGQALSPVPTGKPKAEVRTDVTNTAPVESRKQIAMRETVARANALARGDNTANAADAQAKAAEDRAREQRSVPLQDTQQIEDHVRTQEEVNRDNTDSEKQRELFGEAEPLAPWQSWEEGTSGTGKAVIRSTAARFQKLLNSKTVETALKKAKKVVVDVADKAHTLLSAADALRSAANALLTKETSMHLSAENYKYASRVLQQHKDLANLQKNADKLRPIATDVVVESMLLQGAIDTLQVEYEKITQELLSATAAEQKVGGATAASAAAAARVGQLRVDLMAAQDALVAKQADAAALSRAMSALDSNLRALHLQEIIAALRDAAPFPHELDTVKIELRAAQIEAAAAEEDLTTLRKEQDAQKVATQHRARMAEAMPTAEGKAYSEALASRQSFMSRVRTLMDQFDAGQKRSVRALGEVERTKRDGAHPERKNPYFNKKLSWLKTEVGKVEKHMAKLEKETRAKRGKGNTLQRDGDTIALAGPRARLVAALSRKLHHLEEALDYRDSTDTPLVTTSSTEPVAKPRKLSPELADQYEAVQLHGAAMDRFRAIQEDLKKKMPAAKKDALQTKAAEAEAEVDSLAKAIEELRQPIHGAVSQLSRTETPGAPGKLRSGSAESRADRGSSKRPLTEAHNVASPTADEAIAAGNKAAEARRANEAPLTAEEQAVVAEEQKAKLLHIAEQRESTLRKQLADAKASLAALEGAIAYSSTVSVHTIERKAKEVATIEKELNGVVRERDKLLKEQGTDAGLQFAGIEEQGKVPESVAKALSEGDLVGAIAALSADGGTEFTRALAAKLRPLLTTTKVGAAKLTGLGEYSPSQNTIFLQDGHPVTEHVLLHEASHAATIRALRMPEHLLTKEQLAAKNELKAMLHQLIADKDFTNEYGIKNLEEFVAELSANKSFNDKLSTRTFNRGNWLTKAWDAVKRLLGLTTKTTSSMQTAANAAFDEMLMPSGKTFGPALPLAAYANDRLARAVESTKGMIAVKKTIQERVMGNLNGTHFDQSVFDAHDSDLLPAEIARLAAKRSKLDTSKLDVRGVALRTQAIDALDPIQRIANAMRDSLKASQMMFYLRNYGQRMNFTAQAVLRGGLQLKKITRPDGRTEYIYEAGNRGGGLKAVVDILKDAPAGTGDATNQLFSRYLVAKRAANPNVGLEKMDLGGTITQAHLDEVMAAVHATPGLEKVFKRASEAYNKHNISLLRFAEDTGAISHAEVERLISQGDFVPYYRERGGIVTMIVGSERPIRIGSLKEQPHLKQLVGGDQPILDFTTSSVLNTHLLTDMGLRNQATKDVAMNLVDMGLANISNAKNMQLKGPDVVHFYLNGVERSVRIDTEAVGIPADLLVQGMEGIATTLPGILKVFGAGSHLLRRAITASPLYMARQLFRDSVAAVFVSGASLKTPLAALHQVMQATETKEALDKRGVTGGQIFTGTTEDISNILSRLTSGKGHFMEVFHKLEQGAMEADAGTRRAQFESYKKQGLSEMEATMMSLESMNFSRRGASPSIHAIGQLIPFFNAQIQGLDVLWRAMHGTMPFEEKLGIQKKFIQRGMLLAGMSIAYAMAMQDDKAYKNANPEEKYSNWFVRLPGVDQTVRLPVPFEIGYIFKALPEAIVNMIMNDGTEDAKQAFTQIMKQTIPGGASFGVPQLVRPALEAALNKSFFTGRDIVSAGEARLQPGQQYRDSTSETAKAIGSTFGVSPIQIENLVRGYTGGLGLALLQVVGMPFEGNEQGEKATKRLSDLPLIGTAFQPDDAGGLLNRTYSRIKEIQQVQATYTDMLKKGNRAQAAAFLQANAEDYSKASFANSIPQMMANIAKAETLVRASALTPEEKRERLTQLQQRKIDIAIAVRGRLEHS